MQYNSKKYLIILFLILGSVSCLNPKSEEYWVRKFAGKKEYFNKVNNYFEVLVDKYKKCREFSFRYNTRTIWESCNEVTDTATIPEKLLSTEEYNYLMDFMDEYDISIVRLNVNRTEFVFFGFTSYKIIKVNKAIGMPKFYRYDLGNNYYILPAKDYN